MAKYKAIWETIRSVANLQHQQDPLAQDDGPGVRISSFSGVWLNEGSEEEEEDDDSIVDSAEARESTNNIVAAFDAEDREEAPQPPRVFLSNGTHGASPEESGDCGEEQPEIAERGERAERGGVAEGEFPTTEEGIEVLTEAIIEIADGAALHGGHAARTRLNLKDGTDMFRVDKTKCPIQMSGLTYITAQLAVQRDQDRDQEMRPQHPLHQLRLWHELCQRYLQLNVIAESQMKSRRDGSNG